MISEPFRLGYHNCLRLLRQTVSAASRELAPKMRPVKTKAPRGENQSAQAAPSMGPTVRPAETKELWMPYTQPSSPRWEFSASIADNDGRSPPTQAPARA